MEKFELKKLPDGKYYLNIFQGNGETILISNGFTFEKSELYSLYIMLREIYTNGDKDK